MENMKNEIAEVKEIVRTNMIINMRTEDNIAEVEKGIKNMSSTLQELTENVEKLKDVGMELRQGNRDIRVLLEQSMQVQKEMREDIDSMKEIIDKFGEFMEIKVGVEV